MSDWTVTAAARQDMEKYLPFVLPQWQELAGQEDTELLAAAGEDGAPCGVLLARTDSDRYEIVSLFTEEESRGRGCASALMEAAERSAVMRGCGTLDAIYSAAEGGEEEIHKFFLFRGFAFPHGGMSVYSVPVRSLEQAYLAQLPAVSSGALEHIFSLEKLPAPAARDFAVRLGREIPAALDPALAPGNILQEYSAAYVEDNRIVSFVVFSALEGTIHLHAAYLCGSKHGAALAALLRRAYDMLAADFSQFETFTVTLINSPSERLAEKLLSGSDAVRRTVFYTQKPLVQEVPALPEWGGVLARSNALVSAMAQAGFGTSLCLEPGVLPYLLWSPREGLEVSVFYRVEDEEYTVFSLTAQWEIQVKSPEDAERLAQMMEEDPGPGLLLPSDRADVFALCAVSEEDARFLPEESVEGFLLPFSAQAERLALLLDAPPPAR